PVPFGLEAEQQHLRGMGGGRLEEEMELGPCPHLGGTLRTARIVRAELGPLRAGGARHEVRQIDVEGAPAAHLTPMYRSRVRALMAHPPRTAAAAPRARRAGGADRKSTRLNSSHVSISYAVFCLKKK